MRHIRDIRPLRRAARDERGQVAVEFALVLPLLLLILFAIVDFARAFNYLNDANHIAATGARFASVDRVPGGGNLQSYLEGQGDTSELRDGSEQVTSPLSVCVEFPEGTSNVGDPVRVVASTTFKVLPIVGGFSMTLHGRSTMRIERPPTSYVAGC